MRRGLLLLATLGMLGARVAPPSPATAPVFSLALGTYTGYKLNTVTDGNAGQKITACTIDGFTPATNGSGTGPANDGHSFALNDPAVYTIGASETLQCVTGTATNTDSLVTSVPYVINGTTTIAADAFGIQCQNNAPNCPTSTGSGGITSGFITFPSHMPGRDRTWDASSPFFNPANPGSNCDWASIESGAVGVYNWACLDKRLDAIDAFRTGTNGYSAHPLFTAAFTMGMMPPNEVTLPGPFTITQATGTGTNLGLPTTTFAGNFGSTSLLGLYVLISGMNNPANNLATSATAAITTWSSSSITVTNLAGVQDLSGNSGTLNATYGPKGVGILPADLPAWNGVAPSPGGSAALNNFVTALVAHCSAAAHCFSKEYTYVEMWNEPNNNFFCNPGYCSYVGIYQMMRAAIPIFQATMNGTAGTQSVVIQGVAMTASAATTQAELTLETQNGIVTNIVDTHQYLGNSTSGLPEDAIGTTIAIFAKRTAAGVLGFTNHPVRLTETGYQSTNAPYGCSNTWTANDCYGQLPRMQYLATANAGVEGIDWYNLAINCLNIPACSAIYGQMQTLTTGGHFNSACTQAANVYQCSFTESGGTTALMVWAKCPNDGNYGTCSTNGLAFTIPALYTQYKDLSGNTTAIRAGNSLQVGVLPFMLEQVSSTAPPPNPPTHLGVAYE